MRNDIESALDRRLAHLKVQGLSAGYGPFLVLRELSLEARPGLTVILGPNGAGKTTLLKAIAGLIPRGGRLLLDGDEIPTDAKPSTIVQRGLALVPEGRQLFGQMTVRENLELGGWLVSAEQRTERIAQAFRDFPKLAERAQQLAGTMSGGEQQMVAVARAMMCAPRLLMLDEPSLGLAPRMVDELLAIARRIADAGTTVLMVEQNVRKALAVADRGYVLERGRLVASGPASLLARSTVIHHAYLGRGTGRSARSAAHPDSSKEPTVSDLSMLINGLAVTAEGQRTFERRNPLDGSIATRAPAASPADAVAAVEAAAEAFKTWRSTGPTERRMLLLKAAEALEAKLPKFVEAVPAETGATGMWAWNGWPPAKVLSAATTPARRFPSISALRRFCHGRHRQAGRTTPLLRPARIRPLSHVRRPGPVRLPSRSRMRACRPSSRRAIMSSSTQTSFPKAATLSWRVQPKRTCRSSGSIAHTNARMAKPPSLCRSTRPGRPAKSTGASPAASSAQWWSIGGTAAPDLRRRTRAIGQGRSAGRTAPPPRDG